MKFKLSTQKTHDFEGFKLRNTGREIKDCIVNFEGNLPNLYLVSRGSDKGSILDSYLRSGQGVLNIDDSRIKTQDKLGGGLESNGAASTGSRANAGFERPWMRDEAILEVKKKEAQERVARAESLGRYPANVIFTHAAECFIDGERKVGSGPLGGYSYEEKEYQVEGFVKSCKPTAASNRGSEMVPNWVCTDTCPVRHLDGITGVLTSGANNVKATSGKDAHGNRGAAYGKESRAAGSVMVAYGDSGGASRYFYHDHEVLGYLERLFKLSEH